MSTLRLLRSDRIMPERRPVIITIDGPAGTGKSSVAQQLAERLGLECLDTGAMYRAAALLCLERSASPEDGERLAEIIRTSDMRFDWNASPPRLHLGDRDVSDRIRDLDVSSIVSTVAAQREVRSALVVRQQAIAHEHNRLVSEGRDQGSVVFPDANVSFFLHASEEVRADRRQRQLDAAGVSVKRAEIVSDIQQRDRLDSTRTDGPLVRPERAIDVDTSKRTLEQVVDELERHVRERLSDVEFAQ